MDEHDNNPDTAARLAAYGAASQTLNGWLEGSQALALLEAASASGLLDAAWQPATTARLAALTGLDESRVVDLCLALDAHGVLDRDGDTYALAPAFATLNDPDAPNPLATVLASAAAATRQLAGPGGGYAGLPADEMLAIARGVTVRPGAALAGAALGVVEAALPEIAARWARGGRHIEVGCGIGGGVLGALLRYPALTAVGIDREAAPLGEARRAAGALGVADRVELRQQDARDLADEVAYDTAFWSQFFFPRPTRTAALAAIFRALRPGGYLGMPILPFAPETPVGLRTAAGRQYARNRVRVRAGGDGRPLPLPAGSPSAGGRRAIDR